jgi:hypothetical protein
MNTKVSPYESITAELTASGLLIPIRQAAKNDDCCEGTLKANAKARRLRGFQASFGAPVMVLPSDVEEFLKSRPDIASKHHPRTRPAVPSAGPRPTSARPITLDDFHFPDAEGSNCGVVGDLGISITLRSFNHAQPSEIALVAQALTEVGRQLLELLPPNPTHTNH